MSKNSGGVVFRVANDPSFTFFFLKGKMMEKIIVQWLEEARGVGGNNF